MSSDAVPGQSKVLAGGNKDIRDGKAPNANMGEMVKQKWEATSRKNSFNRHTTQASSFVSENLTWSLSPKRQPVVTKEPQSERLSYTTTRYCFLRRTRLAERLEINNWRVLLRLLPLSTSQWPDRLKSKRNLYKQFIADFITTEEDIMKNETEPTFEDNPLSTEPGSKWNTFFKDEELRETIAKDVHRTHPSYSFFTQGTTYDVMKRMLFIFAKLNPGVSYIQGMNEVLAPLYYTFMTDTVKNSDIYPPASPSSPFTILTNQTM